MKRTNKLQSGFEKALDISLKWMLKSQSGSIIEIEAAKVVHQIIYIFQSEGKLTNLFSFM